MLQSFALEFPLITNDIAQLTVKAEADYMESLYQALLELPGNPFEVEIRRFGKRHRFCQSAHSFAFVQSCA